MVTPPAPTGPQPPSADPGQSADESTGESVSDALVAAEPEQVRRARALLTGLENAELQQQIQVYDDVHQLLREALQSLDGQRVPAPAGRPPRDG